MMIGKNVLGSLLIEKVEKYSIWKRIFHTMQLMPMGKDYLDPINLKIADWFCFLHEGVVKTLQHTKSFI